MKKDDRIIIVVYFMILTIAITVFLGFIALLLNLYKLL
jgi:hypothetical protein